MAVHPSNNDAPEKKRKNPPTFRHLPQNRAQKLKKAWIEKRKLKTQWRAQKRKDGLFVKSEPEPEPTDSTEDVENYRTEKRKATPLGAHGPEDEEDDAHPHSQSRAPSFSSTPFVRDAGEEYEIDSRPELERPPLPRKRAKTTVPQVNYASRSRSQRSGNRLDKPKGKEPFNSPAGNDKPSSTRDSKSDEEDGHEKTSLRELTRRAYAPSSLHTFKSDPLHRRKDAFTRKSTSKPAGPPVSSSRGAGRNQGGQGGGRPGRGQPNMKLRMDAMLERIKRDHS